MTDIQELQTTYNERLNELELVAARSTNICLVAKYIALKDGKVQQTFLSKLAKGHVFNEIKCLSGIYIPEHKRVYFDFDCADGTMCFIKPAFLAVVDVVGGTVLSVSDPYVLDESESVAAMIQNVNKRALCDIGCNALFPAWYEQVVAALKAAKNSGLIRDKGHCKSLADNTSELVGILVAVGLGEELAHIIAKAITKECLRCACDRAF